MIISEENQFKKVLVESSFFFIVKYLFLLRVIATNTDMHTNSLDIKIVHVHTEVVVFFVFSRNLINKKLKLSPYYLLFFLSKILIL